MKIIIEIELGNEDMRTGFDVVHALCGDAKIEHGTPMRSLSYAEPLDTSTRMRVFDINGNVVGKIEVVE